MSVVVLVAVSFAAGVQGPTDALVNINRLTVIGYTLIITPVTIQDLGEISGSGQVEIPYSFNHSDLGFHIYQAEITNLVSSTTVNTATHILVWLGC